MAFLRFLGSDMNPGTLKHVSLSVGVLRNQHSPEMLRLMVDTMVAPGDMWLVRAHLEEKTDIQPMEDLDAWIARASENDRAGLADALAQHTETLPSSSGGTWGGPQ